MAYKAKFWKKVRRFLSRRVLNGKEVYQRNALSQQVGKLLERQGSEIITMTTL